MNPEDNVLTGVKVVPRLSVGLGFFASYKDAFQVRGEASL
jgi:hypothetical protein